MFPYILLVSVSALAMGVLNSFDRFGAPAFAPVLFNLSIIGMSFVTGWFSDPETALAVGVVVGGVLQIAVQVPGLWRSGWRFLPSFDWKSPAVGRVARLMGPVVLGTGVVQVNVVVGSLFASYLEEGAVSALNLSDRVMELVLGGYAIAIATVILPLMSRQAASRAMDEMKQTLNFASRLVLFITIPSTIGLVVLREPIIRVLFQHGEFGPDATQLTAWPLLFYAVGLSAFAMIKIVVPAFHSMQDTRTPVTVAFIAMILNVAFNFAFFGPLQVGGPALATSLAAVFNALALLYLFVRRQGSIGARSVFSSALRFGVASVLLGVAANVVIGIPGVYEGQEFSRQVLGLGVAIGAGTVVYFGPALLLRCREIGELRRVFSGSGS
jgi:putative peptidoglycan lipid II flippase